MYELNDTIVAVSSPSSGQRVIVRITGPDTIKACQRIVSPLIVEGTSGLMERSIAVDDELKVDAKLYLFLAPHSYTGENVAEIHIHTSPAVTEALMDNLLCRGLRMAGPGEFTARAYLNGKIDLAQAEAVNEVIVSSNKFQLAAAEKLLAGRLAEATEKVRANLMDCLSLIEAGLDFSGEDIELGPHCAQHSQYGNPFITRPEEVEKLVEIKDQLEQMLSGSIRYESVIDLPAVGIAGEPNAGKSSLVNKLLGKERSIVSHRRQTTRDVLTGMLTLAHCRCVLFDCAGLTCDSSLPGFRGQQDTLRQDKLAPASAGACRSGHEQRTILDELAQQAAIEALRNSAVVVFCVDISQDPGPKTQGTKHKDQDFGAWTEEIHLWSLVRSLGSPGLVPVATKCDLVSDQMLSNRLAELNKRFAAEFLPISIKTNTGIELLQSTIDRKLIESVLGTDSASFSEQVSGVALTARHRQSAGEAIESIGESINELQAGNDEVAAMMLRATYKSISDIEQQHVDEGILDRIFSRFCIGK